MKIWFLNYSFRHWTHISKLFLHWRQAKISVSLVYSFYYFFLTIGENSKLSILFFLYYINSEENKMLFFLSFWAHRQFNKRTEGTLCWWLSRFSMYPIVSKCVCAHTKRAKIVAEKKKINREKDKKNELIFVNHKYAHKHNWFFSN